MNTLDPTDTPDYTVSPTPELPGRPSAWRHLVNQASKLALATIGILIAVGFAYYFFIDHNATATNVRGGPNPAAGNSRSDAAGGAPVLADATGGRDATHDRATPGETVDSSFRRLAGQSDTPARRDDPTQAALGAAGAAGAGGRTGAKSDDIPPRFDVDGSRKLASDRTRTDVPLEDPGLLMDQPGGASGTQTKPAAETGRPRFGEMPRPVDTAGRPIDTSARSGAGTTPGAGAGTSSATGTAGGEDYVIKDGDTFANLGRKLYGKASAWTDIAQANPTVDPNRLHVGQVIKLPRLTAAAPRTGATTPAAGSTTTPTGRTGRGTTGAATSGASTPSTGASTPTVAAGTTKTYVVQDGDTLWSIATKEYGDGAKLELIVSANHLADANSLKSGDKLTIPAAR